MANQVLFTLSVVFSLIVSTAAVILSLLLFEILRQSPFGRAVFVLSVLLALFVVYHVVLLVVEDGLVVAQMLKSAMFTGTAIFVWIMVWNQYRIQGRTLWGAND